MKPPVLMPGDDVTVADGQIPAHILTAELYPDGTWMFNVAWWNEGIRHVSVFDASELKERT